MTKSSTLIMAIILVVAQAVLIMGVFAAVSKENSAALGEKEVNEEPQRTLNPSPLKCCNSCTPVSKDDPSGFLECQDEHYKDQFCGNKNGPGYCLTCQKEKNYSNNFKCFDVFNGTCGPRCPQKK